MSIGKALLFAGGALFLLAAAKEEGEPAQPSATGDCTGPQMLAQMWDGYSVYPAFQDLNYYSIAECTQNPDLCLIPQGCDCSGLFKSSANKAGCYFPRRARDQFALTRSVSEAEAMQSPGAFVGLRSRSTGNISHIEMSTGDGRVMACWQGSGTSRAPQPWDWWKSQKQMALTIPEYGVLDGGYYGDQLGYWQIHSGL